MRSEVNMTQLSKSYARTVNNITMAMPHSGVIAAAIDPLNSIAQPHDTSVSFAITYTLLSS